MAIDPLPAVPAEAGAILYVSGQTQQWSNENSNSIAVPGAGLSRPRSTLKAAVMPARGCNMIMAKSGNVTYPALPALVRDGNGYYGETWQCWVWVDDAPQFFGDPNSLQILFKNGYLISSALSLRSWKGSLTHGTLRFLLNSFDTVYTDINGSIYLNDGRPHHVAVTRYGKNGVSVVTKIYVDGKLDGEQNWDTPQAIYYFLDDQFSAGIGGDYAFSGMKGQISHIAYFGRALSDTEVMAQYSAGNLGPTLQYGIWAFDKDSGWVTALQADVDVTTVYNSLRPTKRYWNNPDWRGKPNYP